MVRQKDGTTRLAADFAEQLDRHGRMDVPAQHAIATLLIVDTLSVLLIEIRAAAAALTRIADSIEDRPDGSA